MKLDITTKASRLTDSSTIDEVRDAVSELKSMITAWHRQDAEDIYWTDIDWEGAVFACIMKDGSYRFASLSLDEDGEGCVSRWFDFIDLPEDKEYETDDIDMWCMLPWKPGMYISGVYMDGVEIQKGPQSADQFKKKA